MGIVDGKDNIKRSKPIKIKYNFFRFYHNYDHNNYNLNKLDSEFKLNDTNNEESELFFGPMEDLR